MHWDSYFLEMAGVTSKRSPDMHTHHGCVIVDKDNRIVSTGYNGSVKGLTQGIVETARPQKYAWTLHAEENAVLFARTSLEGCTAYVTGHPCCGCFRRFAQVGIKRIVYGATMSRCISPHDFKVMDMMRRDLGIELINLV